METIPEAFVSQEPEWKATLRQYTPLECLVAFCTVLMYFVDCSNVTMTMSFFAIVTVAWATGAFELGKMMPMKDKAVLITGCDTGFGHWLSQFLDQQGVTVYAGCLFLDGDGARKLKSTCSDRVHVLQMDVTDDGQVNQCLEYVHEQQGKHGRPNLWGLVNNAALNIVGDIELTSMERFTRIANINQLGVVRVTKVFLPLIRQTKGRVVNVTSVNGRMSLPFTATYSMTKFAVETFSDILRLEMKKFGVGVSIVEPGNFGGATQSLFMPRIRKDFEHYWNNMDDELRQTYGKKYVDFHVQAAEKVKPTAQFNVYPVIEAMTHGLFAGEPRARYMVGGGNGWIDTYKLWAVVTPFLPEWLLDAWTLRGLDGYFPKPKALL